MPETTLDFGTKSETLERLQPLLNAGQVLPLVYFTPSQWKTSPKVWLRQIRALSGDNNVIVRSSAKSEDGIEQSMAGAFTSCLNVQVSDDKKVIAAVETVISSFSGHEHEQNQVLVQPMLQDTHMSGVLMTHDMQNGAPYYIVNYDDESGLTDTITGGIGIQKTVLIYRRAGLSKLRSLRLKALIQSVRELEKLFGNVPLDIEFAISKSNQVYILQARRMTLSHQWHPATERYVERQLEHVKEYLEEYLSQKQSCYGDSSILGVMPDWNPAEIIGITPKPLAVSLYRYLITDYSWHKARSEMGYRPLGDEPLMVIIASHPYIDVRLSFNSFLPKELSPQIGHKLINAWLKRLNANPQWHDKVEFEIAQTCLDFCFDSDYVERYQDTLSAEEFASYRSSLSELTIKQLRGVPETSLDTALAKIRYCAKEQQNRDLAKMPANISMVKALLIQCRDMGAEAFAIIARHAFIAEVILRSACRRQAISTVRLEQWKQSIPTVSSQLSEAYSKVCQGDTDVNSFLSQFGHLRPGTYDITSFRYDERHDIFGNQLDRKSVSTSDLIFSWTQDELSAVQLLIDKEQWNISAADLFDYGAKAIQGREYAKFIFTRDLSDSLSILTLWGSGAGLSTDDLSYLNIRHLLDSLTVPLLDDKDRVWSRYSEAGKKTYDLGLTMRLGHLITHADDIFVVPLHRALPNFITSKMVTAFAIKLNQFSSSTVELKGKIVCIVNADPGFDWIFTQDIAGLVTQYGGTNSHMAIRCSEFGIAAAIGCGEQFFNRIADNKHIALNCQNQTLSLVE